jgi:hypothetical protein
VFGRPVVIRAEGKNLTLELDSFRSAWSLRKFANSPSLPLLKTVRDMSLSLDLRIGSMLSLNIIPNASLPVRWMIPEA